MIFQPAACSAHAQNPFSLDFAEGLHPEYDGDLTALSTKNHHKNIC